MCFILISKIIFTNLLQSGAVGAVLVSILSISSGGRSGCLLPSRAHYYL